MKKLIFSVLLLLMAAIGAVAQTSLFSEDFEGGDMPTGWTTEGNGSWSIGTGDDSPSTGAGHGTYNALIVHSTRGNVTKLISPEIDLSSVPYAILSFMHVERDWGGDIDELRVYYRTSSSDSWTQIAAYTSEYASWTTEEGIVLPYTTSTYQLAFEMTDNWGYGVGIDYVNIIPPASCPKPTALTASGFTDNSAVLSWTQAGDASNWVLEYSTNSDFSSASMKNVSGTSSYTLTNLNPLTTYYVRVKANCGGGDESEWSNEISFSTTAVAEVVGDSWSDDFEGATCEWELINGDLKNAWVRGIAANNGGTHALYISNDNLGNNRYTVTRSAMVYATKLLGFTTGKYIFSYDWNANGESTFDYLRVALVPASVTLTAGESLPSGLSSTTIPDGWIALDGGSKLNLVTEWQTSEFAVNVTAGNYYLVFAWRNDGSDGTQPPAAVDNVSISRMSCAYDVANLAVSNITTTGATLAWIAGGASQWQVVYSTSADFAGATEEIVDAATYNMTSLTIATTYYVKVRAYCGGTDFGAWSQVLEFTTACDAITSFPWTENFDSYNSGNFTVTCWVNEHISGNGTHIFDVNTSSHGTNSTHQLCLPDMSSGTMTKLVLPPMYLSNENVYVFGIDVYRNTSTSNYGEGIRVFASSDGNIEGATELGFISRSYATSDAGHGIPAETTSGWYSYKLRIPFTGSCYIILRGESKYGSSTYMDNFFVREASSAAEILTYSLPTQVADATIDSENSTVAVTVAYTTDLNALAPVYTISENAEISAPVATINGESCTIEYDITAEDGITTKHWTVTVTKAPVSHDAFITAFTFSGQKPGTTAEIVSNTESNTYTVNAVAVWNVNLASIAPEITISNAATIVPASGASQDFTSPVTYTVTAEDGTTSHTYSVTIINDPDACINPATINVTDITTTTATLGWVQAYIETSYLVKVSTTAMTDMTATADVFDGTVDATTKALNGLTADTEYYVYLQSACNDAEGWVSTNFRTLCVAITVDDENPYTEDFNFYSGNSTSVTAPTGYPNHDMPPCWNFVNLSSGTNTYPQMFLSTHAGYPVSGNCLFFKSSRSTPAYAVLPRYSNNIEDLVLEFTYRNEGTGSSNGTLHLGVATDLSDLEASYVEVKSFDRTTTLTPQTVVFANETTETGVYYIVFKYVGGTSDNYYLSIDNIVVRKASTAAEILSYSLPTQVAEATITSGNNAGTIDITVTYTTDFDVDLDNPTIEISDHAQISVPAITGNGDSRTIVYTVTAESGNTKEWTVNVNKAPVNHDAFITGFTFAGLKAGTNASIVSNTESDIYTVNAVAEWYVDITSIAPEITISTAAEITPESGYARDFTSPVTYTVTAEDGTTSHIYNVTIISDPYACVNPLEVNANNVTTTTAILSWDQAYTETSYIVKVSTEEMTNMAATANVFDGTVYATTKALENLTENTQYFVYVQSNCIFAEGWTEYSFRTECHAFSVPFVEAFGNESETYGCWRVISNNTENENEMGLYDLSGNNVFRFSSYAGASDYNQYLFTPELALTEDAVLTFDYAKSHSSNETFRVMTSTTDRNIASFTALGTDVTVTSTNFTEYRITVPAATKYIAINYFSTYEYYLYVDNFKLTNIYTITASAGANGSIAPDGNVEVEYGASHPFAISPDDCYHIASVLVDGTESISNVDENGIYTFQNVTANHNIAATFAINTYNITTTVEGNGTISGESTANCGDNKSFVVAPANACYRIASFSVDGVDAINDLDGNGVYALQNITADHDLAATFEQKTYTITATAGENGTITETSAVNCGENKEITITPANCYRIASVLVDDVDVTATVVAANGVYTFENIMANHTIAATFEQITYTFTVTADANGSITANDGNGNVANCGENKMFTIVANDCYHVVSVLVDGVESINNLVNGVYTFENVTGPHTIAATFAINTYNITTTVEGNGTISGESSANCGDNKSFVVAPANACYRIASFTVDGVDAINDLDENGVYAMQNITADHTLAATFEQITYTITATAEGNGTITETSTVNCGENKEITITPANCYSIASVLVDDVDVTSTVVAANGVYTFENVMANHTIAATFEQITYTITATADANGSITANDGNGNVANCGENKMFTIAANDCYHVVSVLVDGIESINSLVDGVYTFENVTATHTIAATFAINTYNITTNVEGNGTISGESSANCGDNKSFVVAPANACYRIASFTVDGVDAINELDGNGVYAMQNITADHALAATFEQITYTITATADANGSITANDGNGNIANCGENKSFTIAANDCYQIASVLVDDVDVTATVVAANGVYTFENVMANHTIAATFEQITYTITATADANGSITANDGNGNVANCGENKMFTIAANDCYHVVSVLVDGVESINSLVDGVYTFANVTANHTIVATFAINTYTITATAGEGGSITETSTVNCGENKSFTISANEGYRIASVIVDETENVTEAVIAAEGVYTFENVTANHTIAATFERVHIISAATGADGSITPEGFISVLDGESQTFTITPVNECFRIGQVIVDGVDVTDEVIANNGVYTFENVTENHNIVANFDAITLTITATASEGGTITHNADYEVIPCASNESYTIVANEGYRIVSVIVDDEFYVTNEVIANNGLYTFTNVRANHTIAATFGLIPANTYTITATSGENGTITPNGEVVVYEGDDQNFTIVPAEGYRVASVMVDETEVVAQLVNGVYTFTNVTANHTIAATFEVIPTYTLTIHYVYADNTPAAEDHVETLVEGAEYSVESPAVTGYTADQLVVEGTMPANDVVVTVTYTINTYTITATAGENGTITPSGDVVVNYGATQAFTIAANEGYRIASVLVDEVEAIASLVEGVYTFDNVTANHTIAATYEAIPTYTLTIHYLYADNTPAAEDHVEILVEGAEYSVESPVVTGYTADQLVVEGTMPANDVVVNVTYTINTYTIAATAGENGTITPSGDVVVNYSATQAFTIVANDGYRIMSVLVDGAEAISELVDGVYTFANVSANHTIAATFVSEAATTYTITAIAGENGTITPSGVIEVVEGESKSFTIEAATGYHIVSVMVDETENVTEQLVNGVYTFENVTANHTIAAAFAINTYTITATAGDNGTITPAQVSVNHGASQEFTILANEGYRIASVMVDETVNVTAEVVDNVYTFTNVTANHTIAATFEAIPVPTYTITLTVGEHGSVTPIGENGIVTVNEGDDITFTVTPDEGYLIGGLIVDGTPVYCDVEGDVVNFYDIHANHTIEVVFTEIPATTHTIQVIILGNGSVTYGGEELEDFEMVTVAEGATPEFTMIPAEGYMLAEIAIGEADAPSDVEADVVFEGEVYDEYVYTFDAVTSDMVVFVTFVPPTRTVTFNVGEHGTVSVTDADNNEVAIVDGVITVNYLDDLYLEITPDENYKIETFAVNGVVHVLDEEDELGLTWPMLEIRVDMTVSVTFTSVIAADMLEAGSMTVYPNPNNGMFSIDFSNIDGDATYQLINANGAVVETRDINVMNGETMNFNHDLRPGAYFVRIINGDKVYVEQIVVE